MLGRASRAHAGLLHVHFLVALAPGAHGLHEGLAAAHEACATKSGVIYELRAAHELLHLAVRALEGLVHFSHDSAHIAKGLTAHAAHSEIPEHLVGHAVEVGDGQVAAGLQGLETLHSLNSGVSKLRFIIIKELKFELWTGWLQERAERKNYYSLQSARHGGTQSRASPSPPGERGLQRTGERAEPAHYEPRGGHQAARPG